MIEPVTYRGRFAPSPTGPLHFGSLLAALASYLDARSAGGEWLLRIEDIDPPREVHGAADAIRSSLEAHGLHWDGPVLYQSARGDAYDAALEHLAGAGRLFPCLCTRSVLGPGGSCGGRCAPGPEDSCSLRLRLGPRRAFDDLILGHRGPDDDTREDIVLRRRDGLYAYSLAVVVDDAWQGITHVLRGADLLGETAIQLDLFDALGSPAPAYGHVPVVHNESGTKLSKQTGAPALDDRRALANLRDALRYLNQPAAGAAAAGPAELLAQAVATWDRGAIAAVGQTPVYPTGAAP